MSRGDPLSKKSGDEVINFWNGVFQETIDFEVSSDGAVITGSLAGDLGQAALTMMFSDGLSSLDVSTPLTIVLTPGALSALQDNYIYIPQSTKVLTVSASGWPVAEHIRVAFVSLLTATQTQNDGSQVNQNFNDHIVSDTTLQGHLTHITNRIRKENAKHDSGAAGTLTISAGDLWASVTSGVISQLHEHVFPALDMQTGDDIHIVNNFAQPFVTESNLNTQTLDAAGISLANSSFSFVLWGVQNRTGQASHIMLNLPTGKYAKNDPDEAVADPLNKSVYAIPKSYVGRGFLIARFTLILEANGTTWTLHDTEDLRGKIPNSTAGGGAGGIGVTEWTALIDTPSSYIGQKGRAPIVNQAETALEFADPPVTILNAATYILLISDRIVHVIYTTTGPVTSLTIPTALVTDGKEFTIKDAGGNAGTNNITVDTEGGETIDGSPTYVLDLDYESLTLYSDGSNLFIK